MLDKYIVVSPSGTKKSTNNRNHIESPLGVFAKYLSIVPIKFVEFCR